MGENFINKKGRTRKATKKRLENATCRINVKSILTELKINARQIENWRSVAKAHLTYLINFALITLSTKFIFVKLHYL